MVTVNAELARRLVDVIRWIESEALNDPIETLVLGFSDGTLVRYDRRNGVEFSNTDCTNIEKLLEKLL